MSTTNILDLNNRIDALEKKHDAGGSASDTTFDSTGTDLTATNVQTAIQEVNTKTNTAINGLRQTGNDITENLDNLLQAIAELDLAKYGYAIGDYFVGSGPNTLKYYLADYDTFYGGYNNYAIVDTHHLGVVVDTNQNVNYESGTYSSYINSDLHELLAGSVLNEIKADMISFFGGETGLEHLIANDKLYPSGENWAWGGNAVQNQYISALTEVQAYGATIWSMNEYQQGEGIKQLELFQKKLFAELFGNVSVWLRSLSSTTNACAFVRDGRANNYAFSSNIRAVGIILLKGEIPTRE